MGGPKRDAKDYIFKKPIEQPKPYDTKPPRNVAPPWIDLEELAFGKKPKVKNPLSR